MKQILTGILLLTTSLTNAQFDTSKASLMLSGYVEAYYGYDLNEPENHSRPSFIYSHNRHNEFNLNLGFIKASYLTDKVRANFALASGTYMNANYASETGVLKSIYEANAGFKISKNKNLWVDAGVFASHIGFESAISKDCRVLTRSILAENSPYFESGAKISYTTDNSKWFLSGLVLNGWQRIQRPDANNSPAFGTQITYTPNSKITLNYSTFFGNDKPDTSKQMRYFNNLYGLFQIKDNFHLTAGFDFGMEEESAASSDFNNWYSPVIILQFKLNNQWTIAGRAEYYVDENGVIIATGTENGFKTTGFSLNVDYKIRDNAVWRIEGRKLDSKDKIFSNDIRPENNSTFVTTSIAISF
ncbi:MAG: porin [Bacteroidetes bacterium]|nr:porin [Bacteroidota bacterium]